MHRDGGAGGAGDQGGCGAEAGGFQGAGPDTGVSIDLDAIAAADHAGRVAAGAQALDRGNHHRRLACAAHIDVTDHHHRHRGAVGRAGAFQVLPALARHRPCGQRGQWQQQARKPAAVLPLARQQRCRRTRGGHREVWAAKLTRPMPASRAASMMLITDWWVAWASALMTTSGSGLPAAAWRRASAISGGVETSISVPFRA
ncbi:hypothetical protein G6F50_014482 [Rhizopus delemar]|uniref:Uncharacterized protein n=1 Tax=Rhizopus delemar TaxID=936053 RepID=A0A9P7C7Z8_9FUNG|nr:hypothetical protein G6F50_014482 [Rhizopus delemar]